MAVQVEFFGIPRQRAGVPSALVTGLRLGEILCELSADFPKLAETCVDGQRLRPGFVANLNGERFVTDPDTSLDPGDCLLILTADAGG